MIYYRYALRYVNLRGGLQVVYAQRRGLKWDLRRLLAFNAPGKCHKRTAFDQLHHTPPIAGAFVVGHGSLVATNFWLSPPIIGCAKCEISERYWYGARKFFSRR